jgi:hypothetical protein
LNGAFIRVDEPEAIQNDGLLVYPFTLLFPNKERKFYLLKKDDRNNWLEKLKLSIGYNDFS